MNNLFSRKENFLFRQLLTRINHLTNIMHQEGIPYHQIYNYFVTDIFESQFQKPVSQKTTTKEVTSQTEEETNSESSDLKTEHFQIALEQSITSKTVKGLSLQKILLSFIKNTFTEQEKLSNYLREEEVVRSSKTETFYFDKVKVNVKNNKGIDRSYQSIEDLLIPKNEPSLSKLCSIRQKVREPKRQQVDDGQNEYEYIRSFQRSLNESIRRTKMMRNMLEKRLVSGFAFNTEVPSEFSFDEEQLI